MKYGVTIYAKALAKAMLETKEPGKEKKILSGFFKVIAKNGDTRLARKILDETESILAKHGQGNIVRVESARSLRETDRKKIMEAFRDAGRIDESIIPSLVAGVKITVNDERELDASMSARLRKLFN